MSAEYMPIPAADRSRRGSKQSPAWVKWAFLLLVLAVAWLAFGEGIVQRAAEAGRPLVKTARAEQRSAGQVAAALGASANGYIVAKKRAALSADAPGRIVEMNVEEGSVVEAGQIVARLYADEHAANLRRAEAEVEASRATETRVRREFDAAKSAVQSARSAVQPLQQDLAQVGAARALAATLRERADKALADGVGTRDGLDRAHGELQVAEARVASAEARIESARQSVVEAEARMAAIEAAQLEAAKRVDSALAGRDLAQATLDKTMVKAPFDGVVVLKDAEVGEVVSPNVVGGTSARGSVVTMVDFASLEVQAEVPETSLASVSEGASAQIYLDAWPDRAYPGKVDRIWPTANRTKATVEVRVAFLERDDKLRPEMGVRIVFAPKDASSAPPEARVLVPAGALVRADGAPFVWLVAGGAARKRVVEVGEGRAGKVAILSGLEGGEVVVLDPPADLVDGAMLRFEER